MNVNDWVAVAGGIVGVLSPVASGLVFVAKRYADVQVRLKMGNATLAGLKAKIEELDKRLFDLERLLDGGPSRASKPDG